MAGKDRSARGAIAIEPTTPLDTPLRTRIHRLADELAMAIRWDTACILLAVYRSEIVRAEVQASLERSVKRQGHTARELGVTRAEYDIPLILKDAPDRQKTVFFVHGLRWAGGRGYSNAYRALNMHREYLVESALRCVFWLTPDESRSLTRHAPDFWAFRHQVADFRDLPADQEGGVGSGSAARIERARQTLIKHPGDPAIHMKLAQAFAQGGCVEDAIREYKRSLRLDSSLEKPRLELARLYSQLGREDLAQSMRRAARRLDTNRTQPVLER